MFVCDDCGSENVQRKAWVDLNTDSVFDDVEPFEAFCEECEEPTKVSEVAEKHWKFVNSLRVEQIISDLESIGVAVYDYDAEEIDCKISYCDSIAAGDLSVY